MLSITVTASARRGKGEVSPDRNLHMLLDLKVLFKNSSSLEGT
jgi:hypothetical protein